MYNLYTGDIMKKIIILVISLVLLFFLSRCYVVNKNNKYLNSIKEEIKDNYKIKKDIKYLNKTNLYYIILTTDNLIVLDNNYNEIFIEKVSKLSNYKKNYEIVYRKNKVMYEAKKVSKDKVVYKYYDIYTGELLDTINIGGTNG